MTKVLVFYINFATFIDMNSFKGILRDKRHLYVYYNIGQQR